MYQLITDVEYAADEIEGNLEKKAAMFTVAACLVVKIVEG